MSEELIRRSDAIKAIRERLDSPHMQNALQQGACLSILRAIENAPTIEPKRGEWIEIHIKDYKAKCSHCGTWSPIMGNFCPNCGARMKGADDDNN